jgi:hypothetical protein
MSRGGQAPAFVRPAILEAVLLATLGGAAALEVLTGAQMHCTALVEFGMLSAIAAAGAGALFARYTVELCGLLADYRLFEVWGARLSVAGYLSLGAYAFANGILDVAVPRREADWISYPGLLATVAAVLIATLVVQMKYRALEQQPSRSLFDSALDDTLYVKMGVVTLAALVGHILAPAWWLDTAIDALFAVLIAVRVRRTRERRRLLL